MLFGRKSLELPTPDTALLARNYPSAKAAVAALQAKLREENDALILETADTVRLIVGMRPVFRGGRTWLVNPASGRPAKAGCDKQLVAALRRAHRWLDEHNAVPTAKLEVLRQATSPDSSYGRRAIQLALLAPDIQLAILEGRQPPGLSLLHIMDHGVPLAWSDQRARFGFPA